MAHSGRRIHDILNEHAASIPHSEAYVEDDLRVNYADLQHQVGTVAKALIAEGIEPGDRVATLAPSSKEFWITYLASVSIGAIWMGLNPRYKERDYRYLLEDAKPALVFSFSHYDGRDYDRELQAYGPDVPKFVSFGDPADKSVSFEAFKSSGNAISEQELATRQAAVEVDDTAVIVYTSGTTGKPKGAMLSHKAIVSIAETNVRWMGDGLQKTINIAPINHVGALNNVCMNVFCFGGTIIFYHRLDPAALMELQLKEEPTYLVTSPTGFSMLLDIPGFDPAMMGFYKLIVFGGAKTPTPVLKKFAHVGFKMASVYGQTETCGICTSTQFDDAIEVMGETVGKALEDTHCKIIGPDGAELPQGEAGELAVKADYVMSGYFNRPEATKETFTDDGFLRTGDTCVVREDGNIEIVGRIKEMFKSGGYNIYPLEIEQAICEHPKVSQAALFPIPDDKFQEVGFAFVAPSAGQEIDEDELRAYLKDRIANFKVPKRIAIESELPLLPNSKIDKQQLKARLADMV